MDQESLIQMFKRANSNFSTLNYQINSLNYNPNLNQFDQLQHFYGFFKQKIVEFEKTFKNQTRFSQNNSLSKPPKKSENQSIKPIKRIQSACLKSVSLKNIQNIHYFQREIKETIEKKQIIDKNVQNSKISTISKKPIKRPFSGMPFKRNLLPEEIRNNPFADLPLLYENDLQKGLFNLVNQGFLPKDVDLTPGLLRNSGFRLKSARIHSKKEINSDKNRNTFNSKTFLTEKIIEMKIRKNSVFKEKTRIRRNSVEYVNLRAAIKIQCFWRKYKIRRIFKKMVFLAKKMQEIVRKITAKKRLKVLIEQKKNERLKEFAYIQKIFKENWKKDGKYVEIILVMENEENLHLLRLFALGDSNIEIIYISENEVHDEVKTYYCKIFELYEVKNYENRIHFITLQKFNQKFNKNLSLDTVLYYDSNALKKLKSLIKETPAYMLSTTPSDSLIKLLTYLKIACFSGDLLKIDKFSNSEHINMIFQKTEIPYPPRSEIIGNMENMLVFFGKLIINNPNIEAWGFKIVNIRRKTSQLIAYFDLHEFRQIRNLLSSSSLNGEQKVSSLLKILSENIPENLRYFIKYQSNSEFLAVFFESQGYIEAFPPNFNISNHLQLNFIFLLSPIGEITIISSSEATIIDQISLYTQFPQNSLSNLNLELISNKIGKYLYSQGIHGYITTEFLLFEGKNAKEQLFWGIDIKFALSINLSLFSFFSCIMRDGEFDPLTKRYWLGKDETISEFLGKKRSERCFFFIEGMKFEGVKNLDLKEFFGFCKNNELCFDYENREGIVFFLEEIVKETKVGLLIVDQKKEIFVKKVISVLNTLKRKFSVERSMMKKKEIGLDFYLEKMRKILKISYN